MRASVDPAAWLTEHDPAAARSDPFSFADDVLRLGADELSRAGGDLSRALAACPDCRVEIVLAWLAAQVRDHDARAVADGVMLAAAAVGRLNSR